MRSQDKQKTERKRAEGQAVVVSTWLRSWQGISSRRKVTKPTVCVETLDKQRQGRWRQHP